MNPDTVLNTASWQGPNIAFWAITILVLASGAISAFSRNIVRAAFSMFFTLFGIAGYYVLLGSDFVAVTQIIIYVGGILVLLLFGILLTNRAMTPIEKFDPFEFATTGIVAFIFGLAVLLPVVIKTSWPTEAAELQQNTAYALGRLLTDNYLLVFELAGMTLLLGLLGAAYLVRRKD